MKKFKKIIQYVMGAVIAKYGSPTVLYTYQNSNFEIKTSPKISELVFE